MKILIAYATKSGTCAKCAAQLGENLSTQTVDLVNLTESTPELAGYDFVVVGAPVRMGKLHPAADRFMKNNRERLLGMNAGYFICCGYVDSGDEYISKLIPGELLENALVAECFGGEIIVKNQKGFDKFILRMIKNDVLDDGSRDGEAKIRSLPEILPDSIRRFADIIKNTRPAASQKREYTL